MQAGAIISGTAHGALIIVTMLGGLDWWQDTLPEPRITKVTLVRSEELDVQSAAAPLVPMSDIAQIAQPEISNESVEAPSADVAPTETVMDETAEPDSADLEPDLSALLIPDQPEVVVVAPTVDVMAPPSEAAPDIFQPALDGNELNAPTSMSSPPPPRNAPRIDTSAAAKPPETADSNTDTVPEVTDEPGETVEETPQDASAPDEATTEITPEGQQDVEISAFAPQSASRPPRRPRRLSVPTPEEDELQDEINAALQAAQEATQTEPPVIAELSGPEKAVIGDVVSQKWNKSNLTGQENFEQYVVRIAVEVSAGGRVENVSPLEPATPTGFFEIAYRAARSAVLQADRAGGIPLPAGKFPNGVRLVLRFDPASGEIGFN